MTSAPLATTKSLTSSYPSYRLLYRGAISLPDSHLTLDGITFCARIDTPSKNRHSTHAPTNGNNDTSLLDNQLALALESMRGRPTLRFIGAVKLSDVCMDESGCVLMDVHPNAVLTRIYFENVFCLGMYADRVMKDVLGSPASEENGIEERELPQASELGVKIALGDTDGPETTYMVISARLSKTTCEANYNSQRVVQLVVARLTARPPDLRPRLPRPDDPIPRKPPPLSFGSRAKQSEPRELDATGNASGFVFKARAMKRVASVGGALVNNAKKQKLENRGQNRHTNALFKVPEVPPKSANAKGKGKAQQADADVFGLNVVNDTPGHERGEDDEDGEMEITNKHAIKKATLDFLAKTKDPGKAMLVNRSHPEFKEIFQWVYRGVSFALRARMKGPAVDPMTVQRLVKSHTEMYVGGHGDLVVSPDTAKAPPRNLHQ